MIKVQIHLPFPFPAALMQATAALLREDRQRIMWVSPEYRTGRVEARKAAEGGEQRRHRAEKAQSRENGNNLHSGFRRL